MSIVSEIQRQGLELARSLIAEDAFGPFFSIGGTVVKCMPSSENENAMVELGGIDVQLSVSFLVLKADLPNPPKKGAAIDYKRSADDPVKKYVVDSVRAMQGDLYRIEATKLGKGI